MSICRADGMVFLSPRWTKPRYERFYRDEYDSYYRPAVFAPENPEARYANIRKICDRLESLGQLQGRVAALDVGAGMGWSLEWLKRVVPGLRRVSAIESSRHCAAHLRDTVGAAVLADSVEDPWEGPAHDLVILRHVLEHFLDPAAGLRKISDNLAPGGVAYIAVPDMMHPKGQLETYWFRAVHTYYFSEPTLKALAAASGLAVLAMGSETSELWGVFRKAPPATGSFSLEGVYTRQIQVILDHHRGHP